MDKNRGANIIPDRSVKYTGPDIDSLGICNGDFLDDIEKAILDKIQEFALGQGISLPEIDYQDCNFMENFIQCCAADNSLLGIIQTVFKALCEVDGRIIANGQSITNIQQAINYTIVPDCLTVTNTKIDTVLNSLIASYCAFQQKVSAIFGSLDNPTLSTTIVNQITDGVVTQVLNNIKGCGPNDIVKTGTGVNTQVTINGIAPIGSFLFGEWDMSNFDNTGLGLPLKGFCGWALANGANGTLDMRGYTPAMATNIPSSKSLYPLVDPVVNGDADYSSNVGDYAGNVKLKLTAAQSGVPAHGHGVNDPGHTHINGNFNRLMQHTGQNTVSVNDNNDINGREPALNDSQPILSSTTGISIFLNAAQDAVQSHDVRQPTKYMVAIQRIA